LDFSVLSFNRLILAPHELIHERASLANAASQKEKKHVLENSAIERFQPRAEGNKFSADNMPLTSVLDSPLVITILFLNARYGRSRLFSIARKQETLMALFPAEYLTKSSLSFDDANFSAGPYLEI
jgi:hypothetical protein